MKKCKQCGGRPGILKWSSWIATAIGNPNMKYLTRFKAQKVIRALKDEWVSGPGVRERGPYQTWWQLQVKWKERGEILFYFFFWCHLLKIRGSVVGLGRNQFSRRCGAIALRHLKKKKWILSKHFQKLNRSRWTPRGGRSLSVTTAPGEFDKRRINPWYSSWFSNSCIYKLYW